MLNAFLIFLLTLSAPIFIFAQVNPGVSGKPYSAEQTTEWMQTLADGTHIKQTIQNQKVYRDSQGRTRTESQLVAPMASANPADLPTNVNIVDPVAHVQYSFNTQSKIVNRREIPTRRAADGLVNQNGQVSQSTSRAVLSRTAPPVKNAVESDPSRPQAKTEKLDPQTIDGIAVEGRRTTVTYPVGSVGNDREIVTTNEVWSSPELRVLMMTKNVDPRNGEHIQKLSNISRDEPDPSLFQPPAGYEVVDTDVATGVTRAR